MEEVQNKVLADDKRYAANVFVCKHNVVHLNWGLASLRFNSEMFVDFAMMVNDAYHRLDGSNGKGGRGSEDK